MLRIALCLPQRERPLVWPITKDIYYKRNRLNNRHWRHYARSKSANAQPALFTAFVQWEFPSVFAANLANGNCRRRPLTVIKRTEAVAASGRESVTENKWVAWPPVNKRSFPLWCFG